MTAHFTDTPLKRWVIKLKILTLWMNELFTTSFNFFLHKTILSGQYLPTSSCRGKIPQKQLRNMPLLQYLCVQQDMLDQHQIYKHSFLIYFTSQENSQKSLSSVPKLLVHKFPSKSWKPLSHHLYPSYFWLSFHFPE